MTENELRAEAMKRSDRVRDTAMAIVTYAKGLLPVLKDAGREHSAKELDRLLFEHDAAVQDGSHQRSNAAL